MKIRYFILPLLLACCGPLLHAQSQKCSTMDIWTRRVQADPSATERKQLLESATQNWLANPSNVARTQAIITIPVVVHVVYEGATQNISDAQIASQITSMNEDYRLLNPDSVPVGHPFWPYTADSQIEFCLANTDPQGNPTNGITRTSTTAAPFQDPFLDDIKSTANGGKSNWDPTHYLNVWVGELGGGLYGYATFPSDLSVSPELDGVVIDYQAFGSIGTATAPANLGRTVTHEVGHWLNLSHIWGDQTCGDDQVSDTEPAEDSNFGCPSFPHNANNSCGAGVNGEMYMNYMDYVDDGCMNMFTFGQKNRMRAAISAERPDILNSQACAGTAAVGDVLTPSMVQISPNPSNGVFTVDAQKIIPRNTSIVVTNALGAEVQRRDNVRAFPVTIDLSQMPSDLYFVRIANGNSLITQKVVVSH